MDRRIRFLLVATLSVAMLAAPALAAPVRIRATSTNRWNPDWQRVARGQAVVWVNPSWSSADHTVTAYGGNWSKHTRIEPGERTRKVFRRTGRFKYYCRIHGHVAGTECHGMCGVIRVR